MQVIVKHPSNKWQIVIPKLVRQKMKTEDPRQLDIVFTVKKEGVSISPAKRLNWEDIDKTLSEKSLISPGLFRKKRLRDIIGKGVSDDVRKTL